MKDNRLQHEIDLSHKIREKLKLKHGEKHEDDFLNGYIHGLYFAEHREEDGFPHISERYNI